METSEAPRIFSWSFDKTFKRWKLHHQTPTAHDAGGTLFIKDVLPDRTADSAKDVILNNAASLDNTLAEDRYRQNLRKFEIVPSIRRYGEQRRLTSLVPFGKIFWLEQDTSEADMPSTVATKRRTGRHCEASGSYARHGVTDG